MNEIGLVISRWHGDLKWVEQIVPPYDIFIYNRHEDKTNFGGLEVEKCKSREWVLENITDDKAYEVGTNAQHIIRHYDNLNDFTVFLQDNSIDTNHCSDILRRLNSPKCLKFTTYIQNNNGPSLVPPSAAYAGKEIEFEYMSDKFGWLDPKIDWGWVPYRNDYSKIPWMEFVKNMPGWNTETNTPPHPVAFGMASSFIVSKKRILKHPKDYYQRIIDFCNTYIDPRKDDPTRPSSHLLYYGSSLFEPIWQFVF